VLVVDSHAAKDRPADRNRLLELLAHPPGGVTVRDLNWARLTAWRDLIAQFFDAPGKRRLAEDISEVEICRAVVPGSIPTRTLLLTGWLASRLRWKRISAERAGDRWLSRWTSQRNEVVVRFIPEADATDQEPGISTVTLKIRNGLTLSVTRESGSPCIRAHASGGDHRFLHTVPHEALDEPSLLVQELALTGRDDVFRTALAEAVALEKSF
jgi:glucose-6-phosphate dehydrogenase assembly protein OpcA